MKRPVTTIALLALLIALVAASTFYSVKIVTFAQTCYTTAQVQSDTKCLYILNGKVYAKGSRSSPHHGHPCGMDVTSIIPSFHTSGPAKYLDPNYQGNICTAAPTSTPVPTAATTAVPTGRPTVPQSIVSPTTPPSCSLKSQGDADCNGQVDITDFEIWRKEETHILNTTNADFDRSGVTDISDFEIWRRTAIH